jgi:hypothetical protein
MGHPTSGAPRDEMGLCPVKCTEIFFSFGSVEKNEMNGWQLPKG